MQVLFVAIFNISKEILNNLEFVFQEIMMNCYAFTATDENKVGLWYNGVAAKVGIVLGLRDRSRNLHRLSN